MRIDNQKVSPTLTSNTRGDSSKMTYLFFRMNFYRKDDVREYPLLVVIPIGFQNVKNRCDKREESPRVFGALNALGDSSKMTCLFFRMNF